MTDKAKNIMTVCLCGLLVLGIFFLQIITPSNDISESERRQLADFPELSTDSLISGKFMQKFEDYSMDRFPARDSFRTIKSLSSKYLFSQKDNAGLYIADGYISKLEYPMDKSSVKNAADKFTYLNDKYLKDNNTSVYLAVIPDKNTFIAESNGYPYITYNDFVSELTRQTDFAEYIDISDCLELSDYYRTDTHWRQEKIIDVAEKIADLMGSVVSTQYEIKELERDFYGVYYGQMALPVPSERLYYLENDILDSCSVYDHELNKEIGFYDMELANGRDAYEMYLSGSKGLLTITNPIAENQKHLIIFRDSFASSIAPFLATGYSRVTLVDIRYVSSGYLGNMVDFENSDVLFLYSMMVLNNSITLK